MCLESSNSKSVDVVGGPSRLSASSSSSSDSDSSSSSLSSSSSETSDSETGKLNYTLWCCLYLLLFNYLTKYEKKLVLKIFCLFKLSIIFDIHS